MSSECASYYNRNNVSVESFTCPPVDGDATARFCCGFSDLKYCCDDPGSYYPHEYDYMWWLSMGALLGLSIATMIILAFFITLCVLCYLFFTTKPRRLDNGLPLHTLGSTSSPQAPGPSHNRTSAGPQGLRKHFVRGKLDCDNQPPDPERLFQRCFVATVETVYEEDPA